MQQLSPLSHHRISTQRVPKNNIPMGANYFALIDAWAYVTVVPRTKGNKTSRALDEYSWWWHRLYDSFNFSRERDRTIYCSIAVCGPCRNLLEDQLSFFNGIHALDICPLFVRVWQLSCQISSSPILWSILMHRLVRVLIQKKKGGRLLARPAAALLQSSLYNVTEVFVKYSTSYVPVAKSCICPRKALKRLHFVNNTTLQLRRQWSFATLSYINASFS